MPPQLWVQTDMLIWWMRSQPNPQPLLKNSGFAVLGGNPTVLNDPAAGSLLGQNNVPLGVFIGGRLTIGYWLDYDRRCGLEASAFVLGQNGALLRLASDKVTGEPAPGMGRPFFDAARGVESIFPISLPGLLAGGFSDSINSKLWGVELNGITVLSGPPEERRLSLLWGARYVNLSESMLITSNTNLLPGAFGLGFFQFQGQTLLPPQGLTLVDFFKTRDQFAGPQVGLRGEWYHDHWYLKAQAELAIGPTLQSLRISGETLFMSASPLYGSVLGYAPGGFFAQPSNLGAFNHTVFSVVPSVNVQASYEFLPQVWGDVGYSFLAMTDVVRPGLALDRVIALAQSPYQLGLVAPPSVPQARPGVLFGHQGLLAQGLSVGLRITW